MIKTEKPKDIDKFITEAKAEKIKKKEEKSAKYLLKIPENLRKEIRHEAIEMGVNMSDYICSILEKRKLLV